MPRIIRTFKTSGEITEDGDWDPATKTVEEGELNLDEEYGCAPGWEVRDVAEAALAALEGLGCDYEYSSFPHWQPQGWYCSATIVGYDDVRTETTAHLKGFSEEESRLIHLIRFGG